MALQDRPEENQKPIDPFEGINDDILTAEDKFAIVRDCLQLESMSYEQLLDFAKMLSKGLKVQAAFYKHILADCEANSNFIIEFKEG